MKTGSLIRCALLLVLCVSCDKDTAPPATPGDTSPPATSGGGPQNPQPPRTPQNPPGDTASLFLTDGDLARVKRVLPGLSEASHRGPRETAAYLATLDISFTHITQILSNMSVAYSAVKFDQWTREVDPMLDKGKRTPYGAALDSSQRQLQQITSPYREAKQGGRTALDVNTDVVRKNLADVEEMLVVMQGMRTSSMPFNP